MWYLDRFKCAKEKSSSLLMLDFQNWLSYEPLKFCFCVEIENVSEVEKRDRKFQILEVKCDIWVDLGVAKRKFLFIDVLFLELTDRWTFEVLFRGAQVEEQNKELEEIYLCE